MGIFFRFRDAELGFPLLREVIAQIVFNGFLGEGHGDIVGSVALGKADVMGFRQASAFKALEGRIFEGPEHFTGAVGTEVIEDHRIAVFHPRPFAHDDGLDKLIGNAFVVRSSDAFAVVFEDDAFAQSQGVIGQFQPFPAFIAVHGVVAAHDGSDAAHAFFFHGLLDFIEEFQSRGGQDIAAVEKGVERDVFHAFALCHFQQSDDMIDMAVDAAVGEETHEMHGLPCGSGMIHAFVEHGVFKENAVVDVFGDAGQILIDDAAGAHVHMTHFGVADLPFGETDGKAGSVEIAVAMMIPQAVEVGLLSRGNAVALHRLTVAETI